MGVGAEFTERERRGILLLVLFVAAVDAGLWLLHRSDPGIRLERVGAATVAGSGGAVDPMSPPGQGWPRRGAEPAGSPPGDPAGSVAERGREAGEVPPFLRVDLNSATADGLVRLPGLGPVLAEQILAHRASHGPFREVADLLAVPGIGEKTLERIAPWLVVPAPGSERAEVLP